MNEQELAAQAKLKAAIDAYFDELYPGSYIDDWLVIVHRQSIELNAENLSTVSVTIPEGQALYRSVGLAVQAGGILDDAGITDAE